MKDDHRESIAAITRALDALAERMLMDQTRTTPESPGCLASVDQSMGAFREAVQPLLKNDEYDEDILTAADALIRARYDWLGVAIGATERRLGEADN